jgi:hypothetical protein
MGMMNERIVKSVQKICEIDVDQIHQSQSVETERWISERTVGIVHKI